MMPPIVLVPISMGHVADHGIPDDIDKVHPEHPQREGQIAEADKLEGDQTRRGGPTGLTVGT